VRSAGALATVGEQVTARYDRRPYWEVILDLCERTGLRLRCNEAGVAIVRQRRLFPPGVSRSAGCSW